MSTAVVTYTGKHIDLLDPKPEDIDIHDIAHSLSMQCRYNGHTPEFYSVAQHSLEVSYAVSAKPSALAGLMHDAHEAYAGDIVRPVKSFLEMACNRHMRFSWIDAAISYKYKCSGWKSSVCDADLAVLKAERARYFPDSPIEFWPGLENVEPVDLKFRNGLSPIVAESLFLQRFKELTR